MSHCENLHSNDDEELARVVKVSDSSVWVERISLDGCQSCTMHGLCGSKGNPQLKFTNKENLQEGDTVIIKINTSTKLISSFVIFIVPIIILFIFFLLARYTFNFSESKSALISFTSLILSALVIYLFDKYVAKNYAITIEKKRD